VNESPRRIRKKVLLSFFLRIVNQFDAHTVGNVVRGNKNPGAGPVNQFFVDAHTVKKMKKKLKYANTRAFSAVAHNFIPDHEFVSAYVSTLQRQPFGPAYVSRAQAL